MKVLSLFIEKKMFTCMHVITKLFFTLFQGSYELFQDPRLALYNINVIINIFLKISPFT